MQNSLHILSWQGFSVAIPADWNLAHYQGDSRRGLVTLADLRGPVLTIRWQTLRKPQAALAKLVASLKKKGAQLPPPPPGGGVAVSHKTFTGWLQSAGNRLYELEVTGGQRSLSQTVHLEDYSTQNAWPWELYGIKGKVPRRLKLVKASLHPGRPQLKFRRFWTLVQLGAWPMAESLLDGKPLTVWAKGAIPLLRNSKTVAQQAQATRVRFTLKKFFAWSQRFCLTHDADSNTIRWSQGPKDMADE